MAVAVSEERAMNRGISRAVWSFWSAPHKRFQHGVWANEKFHLLSWILSVQRAKLHYPETVLYTDDDGVAMLVDGLGLQFSSVSVSLNALHDADPEWWTLGKLFAYRDQKLPFVHLDADVFLWAPLPEALTQASVFAQNVEEFPFGNRSGWYRPLFYDDYLKADAGWAPEEWMSYISAGGNQALCCGVLGGQRPDILAWYADKAIEFLTHARNKPIWSKLTGKVYDNILFEQYYLSACVNHYTRIEPSKFGNLSLAFLFTSAEEAFNTKRANELGYTHLIGHAKRNETYAARLEERVATSYPDLYGRCLRYLQTGPQNGSG